MMTHRERILAVLEGRRPDRIPWIPRLDLWHRARLAEGNMPARFHGQTLRGVERAIGGATPARTGRIYRVRYEDLEVRRTEKGGEVCTEYVTPVGTLTQVDVRTGDLTDYAIDFLPHDPPIRTVADYGVMEYVYEHTFFDPAYEEYLAYEQEIGEDGYPMVSVGDAPFHHFLLRLSGYNRAYYELADHLPQVEHLIEVMAQVEMERLWPVVLASPARWLLHGVHFDSQMTPPPLYRRYILPYYQQVAPRVHAAGKYLSYHADDDAQAILGQIRESGYDLADCFTTEPMVTVTLAEARAAWGRDIIIAGGVPSVILEETAMSGAEFVAYMAGVFRTIAPGDAFMLAVADNVMPRADIGRVELISRMVEEWGVYPIRS
jgi:hypothetical protein